MKLGRICAGPPGDGWRALRGGNAHPVATVVGLVASRLSAEEITAEYPQLTGEDVRACLGYAARAVDERELPVRLTA